MMPETFFRSISWWTLFIWSCKFCFLTTGLWRTKKYPDVRYTNLSDHPLPRSWGFSFNVIVVVVCSQAKCLPFKLMISDFSWFFVFVEDTVVASHNSIVPWAVPPFFVATSVIALAKPLPLPRKLEEKCYLMHQHRRQRKCSFFSWNATIDMHARYRSQSMDAGHHW